MAVRGSGVIPLEFAFNERKAAESAAFLLDIAGGSMDLLVLLKLLYLADRRALIERGLPITGDRMIAKKNGPILARIYDATKGHLVGMPSWSQFVSQPRSDDRAKRVRLVGKLKADGRLSNYERQILRAVHDEYGHENKWTLSALTHELPEFRDPGASRLPIDPKVILRNAGKSDDEIAWVDELARTSREAASLRHS